MEHEKMTPERFRQVRNLFEAALEKQPAERGVFVDQAAQSDQDLRAEVERMLDAHLRTVTFFDGSTAAPPTLSTDPQRMEGRRFGPYEILRELGKGGMGVVYLGRRVDGEYPKLAAIKVLRPDYASEDVQRRFQQERRILATLDHPNIARLFDSGRTAENLPFYVMEFIEGVPIDQYCDEQRLDVAARVALFQQVCAAVEYAHGKGVVHRDLKPSNILVTGGGVAKLLDFGIAKMAPSQGETTLLMTDAGLRPMTPEYASPEQIRGANVTRVSDVYSLGVVLYELLTGHRPYRMKSRLFHEIVRVVCEEEPTLPSAAVNLPSEKPETGQTGPEGVSRSRQTTLGDLRQQLSGDIDSILLKALRKDPWQRYGSAAQFSVDLANHLAGSPVVARSGRLYRFGKELNKRRGWLAAAVFVVAAWASGAVHLSSTAIWIGAGVAVAFGIWQASADRELGRRIASAQIWPSLTVVVTVAFLITIGGPDSLDGFLQGFHDSIQGGGYGPSLAPVPRPWLWSAINWELVWSVALGALWLKWWLREKWAGRLLLDASSRRNRVILGVMVFFVAMFAVFWLLHKAGVQLRDGPPERASNLFFELPLAFMYALSRRMELRQNGIVVGNGFYPWTRIESHSWEQDRSMVRAGLTGSVMEKKVILKLQMHSRLPFLPPVRIKLPAARSPQVESIVQRYLSEWPPTAGDANVVPPPLP
jgi:serine/threonine protein kinase